jgi:TetR/AcrR family transcriptional regulator, transcriptional repressor of bet genes
VSKTSTADASDRSPAGGEGGSSRIRRRQRQRLIDACISAMHMYGPSRTTVEKVVALADLSPGIVRFYFDSKAAMLVASLEYLAREFDERVLQPVRELRHTPVRALRLLVELYLDADIASARKVSVWYSFWGEASSRQEYYDICGGKDEDFAVLVRELVEAVIRQSGAAHLDADAVALGLIGVLEILWQGLAFHNEADVDRPAAVARALAYLRSVFPAEFSDAALPAVTRAAPVNGRLPAWAYADAALQAAERERLLRNTWQVLGHEAELKNPGDFVTAELAGERVAVVRGTRGSLQALRNSCRQRPHALLATRAGHVDGVIRCAIHGLEYGLDGRLIAGSTPGDLQHFEVARPGGLILVRAAAGPAAEESEWRALARLTPGAVSDVDVRADWKVVVEQWLESLKPTQHFLAPNRLLETGERGALILQVSPVAPGHCRIRRFDFHGGKARRAGRGGKAGRAQRAVRPDAWQRANSAWLKEQVELAESTQAGLASGAEDTSSDGPVPAAIVQFRATILALLHALPAR